jgi:GDP-4-dehydro-6-deoxy-D-mannose reductase
MRRWPAGWCGSASGAPELGAAPRRVFVSGGAGFAGRHLVAYLRGAGVAVAAPAKEELDLADGGAVRRAIAASAPDAVLHLAAFSTPRLSWERPREALAGNLELTTNLLEAVRREAPAAAVVLVGSGQVYGPPRRLPVDEDEPPAPENPYALSKLAGDELGRIYAGRHGLRVARLRPFNHAGPGQDEEYVVSSIARQIAAAELAGERRCLIRTGNPDSARDFTDVRDVVRAYAMAIGLEGTFNVCSGTATPVAELVRLAAAAARLPVEHEVDPALVREGEVAAVAGSAARLAAATGWAPEIPLARTVADALEHWRGALGGPERLGGGRPRLVVDPDQLLGDGAHP